MGSFMKNAAAITEYGASNLPINSSALFTIQVNKFGSPRVSAAAILAQELKSKQPAVA